MIVELKDADFGQVENSKGMAVVLFWQDNCSPCTTSKPYFEEASNQTDALFFTMKKENAQSVGAKLKLHKTPTFVIFKDGKEVNRIEKGIVQSSYIKRKIEEAKEDNFVKEEPEVPAMNMSKALAIKGKLISEMELMQDELAKVNEWLKNNMQEFKAWKP